MPGQTVSEIARALGATCVGQGDLMIQGVSEPADAKPENLAIAMNPEFAQDLGSGAAKAAILCDGADWQSYGLKAAILVERPRLAMAALTNLLHKKADPETGIHTTAEIDPDAIVGAGASIGPFSVIGAGAVIGKSAQIGPQVTIGAGTSIGDDCSLLAGVKIAENVVIGDRFFGHQGVTIGDDGFSFVTREKSNVENTRGSLKNSSDGKTGQPWIKIYSLGGVFIGDDVEIGANSNVDAGTIRATSIGSGTKIDSLVQVGHNVRIGRNCLLCAQVGIAGSSAIGDAVVLGGKVGVADNLTVGDGVVAGAASTILSNVPAGRAVMGSPAVKMDIFFDNYKAARRLSRTIRDVAKLKKLVPNTKGKA